MSMHDDMRDAASLAELLRRRAEQAPERIAFTAIDDDERTTHELSYAQLDQRARAIAARLQALDARGQRVLMMFPTGLDYVAAMFGCMYAGAIAVPAYPPDPTRLDRSLSRLMAIVDDCRPMVALTVRAFLPLLSSIKLQTRLAPVVAKLPVPRRLGERAELISNTDPAALFDMQWLPVDRIGAREAAGWSATRASADDIAYLQYTSGSTSTPKGVIVRHGNALANLRLASELLHIDEHDVAVGWVPLYHDLGLVCHVLGVPYANYRCVLMSPLAFLRRPALWLETIAKQRGSFNAAPNFAYELCVRKTTAAERSALDLSCWRVAGNGGEPVRPQTLRKFAAAFGPSGFSPSAFHPTFGLAEATLFAALGKPEAMPASTLRVSADALARGLIEPSEGEAPAIELASCGRTGESHELRIVDPHDGTPCADGRVGEIWLSGPSVPQGYWQRPEASAQTFAASLPGSDRSYLRTGDLGFVWDGELYVTGRIKELIIIHGRNLYPADVEASALRASELLRPGCAAAFAIDDGDGDGNGEALMLVQELGHAVAPELLTSIAADIRAAIHEDHGLAPARICFVEPRSLPKTSSGKLQRHACRDAALAGTLALLGER